MRSHAHLKTEKLIFLSYYLKPLSHETPSASLVSNPVNPIKHHTLSDIPIHQMGSAVEKEMSRVSSSPMVYDKNSPYLIPSQNLALIYSFLSLEWQVVCKRKQCRSA